MDQFAFKSLLPKDYQINNFYYGEFPLELFSREVTSNGAIYYPSSSCHDIDHLFYLNQLVIPEIKIDIPNVYIHSDAINSYEYYHNPNLYFPRGEGNIWNDIYKPYNFKVENHIAFHSPKRAIELYMLKRPGRNDYTWVICFWGYKNEIVIETLINKNISIPIVKDKCDGIADGMGAADGVNIPVRYYPFLAKDLGMQYIVSQSTNCSYWATKESLKLISKISKYRHLFFSEMINLENNDLNKQVELCLHLLYDVEPINPNNNFIASEIGSYYLKKII